MQVSTLLVKNSELESLVAPKSCSRKYSFTVEKSFSLSVDDRLYSCCQRSVNKKLFAKINEFNIIFTFKIKY
jgi:hypothetical protein